MKIAVWAGIATLLLMSCSTRLPTELAKENVNLPKYVDFNFHIKPLLSDRCFKCHGPDANQRKGNLRLDIEEFAFINTDIPESLVAKVLKSYNPGKSEVYHRIISSESDYMMPPPESNLALSAYDKALIAKWIEQGAEYKQHWAFETPKKSTAPSINNKVWAQHPLDDFIMDGIEQNRLEAAPKASKETLLRRISFDLTGLPPTPAEVNDFIIDESDESFEKAIDRLMESPHFGERMALEWLDVARYADSHGYQDDGMRNTWPWRDWVIKAFNENKPYDEFLLEQLAGDMLPDPTRDQLLATCFNRNHPQSQEGGVVGEEYRVEYVADRTNTLGKALLGITLECARCHDHKYDPITQKEYYSLFALFNNNNDTGQIPYDGEASPTVMLPTEEEEEILSGLQSNMDPLEDALSSENYVEDLKAWLQKNDNVADLSYGLVADFRFDKEMTVATKDLNLDGKPKKNDWSGLGKKGTTTAYFNYAKGMADAAILGDKDLKPELVKGKNGKGVAMMGDCGIRFNRDLDFDRHQPFSVSIWVNLNNDGEKGPIFNNANGDFEGFRGWVCMLNEDNTLSYQLNHVWPDNCIDYRTKTKLVSGKWNHLVMTYDGNSLAKGLRLYVNGELPESVLLKDNLHRSLLHGSEGSNWSSFPFILGKEKERSIENIKMDELKIYNRELSEMEVGMLYGKQADDTATEKEKLATYLLAGKNQKYNKTLHELTKLRKEENLVSTDILEVMKMHELDEPRETFVLDRGVYDAPQERVGPGIPSFISKKEENISNRLELAKWLVSEENPLTSRIIVNRFWTMLFGKGIVATPDDFGSQGDLPSHPELLDWLAVDFMEKNWDVRAFLKGILLSSTYQMSSVGSPKSKELDPTNEWYSHFPAHRLPAEIIRDNALAASGLLVRKIGGPSVYPYQPEGMWKALATRNATEYKEGSGEDLYRRSMYTVWKRSSPPPSMMNFDAPDRYYCVVSRQKTSTPLQSLVLMNDPQYTEAAKALAEMSLTKGGTSLTERLDFMYKSLIGRAPNEVEQETLENLYEQEKMALNEERQRAEDLLNTGEYRIQEDIDKVEAAGHMLLASTIMNFDEFVMIR